MYSFSLPQSRLYFKRKEKFNIETKIKLALVDYPSTALRTIV